MFFETQCTFHTTCKRHVEKGLTEVCGGATFLKIWKSHNNQFILMEILENKCISGI